MPSPSPFRPDPDLARFLAGGVSINAGSGSAERNPSLCRALGCRVEGGGARLTVFFSALQAADLLRDIRQGGAVAVVFSHPPTHQTVQVKGWDARVEPLAEGDLARVAAYRTAFAETLGPLGFPEALVRSLLDCADADLVAVGFTPEAAFNQTPGARAGTPLAAP